MANNITIKTLEGLEVKNLSRGWSMEYGEGGSMHCDIYWNGKKYCEVAQEGNGGCACDWYVRDLTDEDKTNFKTAVLTCLQRLDPSYGENSDYDWRKNKTVEKIDADDLETLEILLEERFDDIKTAQDAFKIGYFMVCVIDCGYQKKYLRTNYDNVAPVERYLATVYPDLKYEKLTFIRKSDNLNIL